MVAFVPEREITHNGYSGAGYIIMDPDTGAAAYLIDGGRNGLSQPECAAGVRPPEAEISVNTILNWDSVAPALVGATSYGAATPEQQESLKALKEFGEQMVKPVAKKIAARVSPSLLSSMAAPGFNTAIGVGVAVGISIEILLIVMAFKVFLQESGIQIKSRTEDDVCECKTNPSSPKCSCEKIPQPHLPVLKPPIENTPYIRRVQFHHMCADNSGNSYPTQDVVIKTPQGKKASFDLFNNQSNTACEVKTSFRKTPYDAFVQLGWLVRVRSQIANQIQVAKECKWNYCLIVNQPWMVTVLQGEAVGYPVYLNTSCRAPVEDPNEFPSPELD